MARRFLSLLLVALAACATVPREVAQEEEESGSVVGAVLLYIPNRIFDVLDVVRLRVRVGPGFALGARATEFADVFLGAYTSVFVGIPGPRGEPEINWPFGIESRAGAEVSLADVSTGAGTAPDYGWLECGRGGQLLILGLDVGVDPWEAVDLLCGIVTFDPEGDDL